MKRMIELITEVIATYPNDIFFKEIQDSFQNIPHKHDVYLAYANTFDSLDSESWNILKNKAINHFIDHRQGQKKQGFFNQLNESFAYQMLKERGYSKIKIIPEDKSRKPDISYFDGDIQKYCEVKTIGISNDEISRRTPFKYINRNCYASLSVAFINKLSDAIKTAEGQIYSQSSTHGIVFVVIHYDDPTNTYDENYKQQLISYLKECNGNEVVFKIGILGNDYIYKSID